MGNRLSPVAAVCRGMPARQCEGSHASHAVAQRRDRLIRGPLGAVLSSASAVPSRRGNRGTPVLAPPTSILQGIRRTRRARWSSDSPNSCTSPPFSSTIVRQHATPMPRWQPRMTLSTLLMVSVGERGPLPLRAISTSQRRFSKWLGTTVQRATECSCRGRRAARCAESLEVFR